MHFTVHAPGSTIFSNEDENSRFNLLAGSCSLPSSRLGHGSLPSIGHGSFSSFLIIMLLELDNFYVNECSEYQRQGVKQ